MKGSSLRILAVCVGTSLLIAGPAQAYEAGDWLFRVGVTSVDPKSDNLDTAVPAGEGTTPVTIEVDSGTTLTFNGTYFFTPNWGLEVLAAAPFNHDIEIKGIGKIAETDHLPPTFSLQYHFLPDGAFQPYVGLGLNMTIFFSEDVDQALIDTVEALNPGLDVTGADLDLDTSFGLAAQVGADFILNENWTINFDVRWINIETDAELTVDPVGTLDLGTVEIDPWVYGINVGYKF
jgi:outer membrane protein